MARDLQLGESVWIPSTLVPGGTSFEYALTRGTVVSILARSAAVSVKGVSVTLATSKIHRDVGIALISVGDFVTEATLTDPLAKSVLQFCRLLVPDACIRSEKFRSLVELKQWWTANQGCYTHVVIVGHGYRAGFRFGVDGQVTFDDVDFLDVANGKAKTFITLCCETGHRGIAKPMSSMDICEHYIAPFHAVHGATASQFLQSFLTRHLLEGDSTKVAFKNANASVPGRTSFRYWKKGELVEGQT